MKKLIIIIVVLTIFLQISEAQVKPIYNEEINGLEQFNKAKIIAKEQNKHILVDIGGNWCKWCIILDKFLKSDIQIDSIINANYIVVKVNYSSKNKNLDLMEKLQYPQRFGFPVIVITDAKGNRLHTQNSWFLEEKESYSSKKVKMFLNSWTPNAILPINNK